MTGKTMYRRVTNEEELLALRIGEIVLLKNWEIFDREYEAARFGGCVDNMLIFTKRVRKSSDIIHETLIDKKSSRYSLAGFLLMDFGREDFYYRSNKDKKAFFQKNKELNEAGL